MNYIDEYSRYHDKPVTEQDKIPSNNGFIYTACAVKLKLPIEHSKIVQVARLCKFITKDGRISYRRSPKVTEPPISRDEILGLAALGVLDTNITKSWGFSPRPLPKTSLLKRLVQLVSCIGKHRNHFWENNLDQVYAVAFRVPLVDRHFILTELGMKSNILYKCINVIDSLLPKKSVVRFVKYNKQLPKDIFPADHPFNNLEI